MPCWPFLSLPMTDCEAWEQLRPWAHREARTVASVRQLVVAGVEGERLHDVRAGPQELSVQLAHCNADAQLGIRHSAGGGEEGMIYSLSHVCFYLLRGARRQPPVSTVLPLRSLSSQGRRRSLRPR